MGLLIVPTRFKQGEKFSGLLVQLAKKGLENGTKNGFNLMNQALKDQVENKVDQISYDAHFKK